MKSLELVQQIVAGILFLATLLLLTTTNGQPVDDEQQVNSTDAKVIYDQRQSGKYNIRINIKDVAIIEMDNSGFGDENLSEEEYYYDEEDLTVKPLKLTSPSSTLCQPLISTLIKTTTSVPTQLELTQSQSPAMITTTTQPTTNAILWSDPQDLQTTEVTTQENITVSSEYAIIPRLISGMEMKLNSKIIPPSSSLSAEHQKTQSIKRSGYWPTQRVFPTKSSKHADSRVFKFMMQQNKKPLNFEQGKHHLRQCRANQYLDLTGSCRNRRSASFLKKLLNIIATFPIVLAKDTDKE